MIETGNIARLRIIILFKYGKESKSTVGNLLNGNVFSSAQAEYLLMSQVFRAGHCIVGFSSRNIEN